MVNGIRNKKTILPITRTVRYQINVIALLLIIAPLNLMIFTVNVLVIHIKQFLKLPLEELFKLILLRVLEGEEKFVISYYIWHNHIS